MLYIVKDSDVFIKNKYYPIGTKVNLPEKQIQGIEQFLEPTESKITLTDDNPVHEQKKSDKTSHNKIIKKNGDATKKGSKKKSKRKIKN